MLKAGRGGWSERRLLHSGCFAGFPLKRHTDDHSPRPLWSSECLLLPVSAGGGMCWAAVGQATPRPGCPPHAEMPRDAFQDPFSEQSLYPCQPRALHCPGPWAAVRPPRPAWALGPRADTLVKKLSTEERVLCLLPAPTRPPPRFLESLPSSLPPPSAAARLPHVSALCAFGCLGLPALTCPLFCLPAWLGAAWPLPAASADPRGAALGHGRH